jgi:ABC-type transport system involved in multi-copper enzyme maturation permease subunit
LDLLLTTTLSPWTIVLGKMLAGFRVSTVLTLLMAWPLVLGIVLNFQQFFQVLPSVGGFVVLILLTCVSTTVLGMFCSSWCRKTSHAIVLTYSLVLLLYFSPPAMEFFFRFFLPSSTMPQAVEVASYFSPFSAAARLPAINNHMNQLVIPGRGPISATEMAGYYWHFGGYFVVTVAWLAVVMGVLVARFNRRWLVSFGEG